MEVYCPSCRTLHRSEDYPGAFDILCGCGYLILNPDIGDSPDPDYNEINFEGPPAADETRPHELIKVHTAEDDFDFDLLNENAAPFSAENLTPPENLPEGMLYDPGEVPQEPVAPLPEESSSNEEAIAKRESTISRIFVERVQRASIGQILGPDYDLEFLDLTPEAKLRSRERIDKFLQDHKWLREEMERRSFIISDAFHTERVSGVPEALAVEMYIACLENGGKCLFVRHSFPMSA
jgi:hypothetical protein